MAIPFLLSNGTWCGSLRKPFLSHLWLSLTLPIWLEFFLTPIQHKSKDPAVILEVCVWSWSSFYTKQQQKTSQLKKKIAMKFQPRFWCKTNFSYKKNSRKNNIKNVKKTLQIKSIGLFVVILIRLPCVVFFLLCYLMLCSYDESWIYLKKCALCLANIFQT